MVNPYFMEGLMHSGWRYWAVGLTTCFTFGPASCGGEMSTGTQRGSTSTASSATTSSSAAGTGGAGGTGGTGGMPACDVNVCPPPANECLVVGCQGIDTCVVT